MRRTGFTRSTGRGNDSQDSALAALAETVYGETLLWITVVGLAALTLWQIFETIWRRAPDEGRITKVFGRTGSLFSAAAYLTVGIGCTGGRHRSVMVANRIGELLKERKFDVSVIHRDIQK